mmetsp:Transcript_85225/g.169070  ORF Transcript_85225/g.169070 Transcript_85225/m.169070 type:complete len:136 (-) Transcript_85225:208-615(-)
MHSENKNEQLNPRIAPRMKLPMLARRTRGARTKFQRCAIDQRKTIQGIITKRNGLWPRLQFSSSEQLPMHNKPIIIVVFTTYGPAASTATTNSQLGDPTARAKRRPHQKDTFTVSMNEATVAKRCIAGKALGNSP